MLHICVTTILQETLQVGCTERKQHCMYKMSNIQRAVLLLPHMLSTFNHILCTQCNVSNYEAMSLTCQHMCAKTSYPCVAGVIPEHIVKQLCNNRVNYYFAQINTSTVQMTNMFAEEYKHSQNAIFKVLEYTASAGTFIPMIVESIRDSMKRSSFFGSDRSAGSSSHRSDKADHRTVFHSIL